MWVVVILKFRPHPPRCISLLNSEIRLSIEKNEKMKGNRREMATDSFCGRDNKARRARFRDFTLVTVFPLILSYGGGGARVPAAITTN